MTEVYCQWLAFELRSQGSRTFSGVAQFCTRKKISRKFCRCFSLTNLQTCQKSEVIVCWFFSIQIVFASQRFSKKQWNLSRASLTVNLETSSSETVFVSFADKLKIHDGAAISSCNNYAPLVFIMLQFMLLGLGWGSTKVFAYKKKINK